MKKKYKQILFSAIGVFSLVAAITISLGFNQKPDDVYFNINKSIDLFGKIYKEVAINYVDELDPIEMMNAGIRGMLSSLDPYTVFIDEQDKGDVEMLTTGKYGGIGITVGVRENKITIISIMEGYSAEREGLRAGDHILEIDGHDVTGKQNDVVRSYMRGEPGSSVKLKIERPGKEQPFEVSLLREEITLKNVIYSGIIEDNIGYIKLDRFSRRAGEDVREAIKQFQTNSSLSGIILDIRDNPGGLLDAAVDIVEKFVPKGSPIVSTRGRKPNATHEYKSEEDPLVPSVPLVVLVNKSSASASEIVAGAIQDLDRGVLIGTRTFGKGLVQNVTPLTFNTSLKITTSRYYTPSGRCIQEVNYSKSDSVENHKSFDSLKKSFTTLNLHRTVFEAGGISPDSVVTLTSQPRYVQELVRKGMLFEFISQYLNSSKEQKSIIVNEDILKSLKQFIEKEKFEYKDEADVKCDELLKLAHREHYSDKIISSVKSLKNDIEFHHTNDFSQNKELIKQGLQVECIGRSQGPQARIKASLEIDTQAQTAIAILKNKSAYQRLLHKPH